MLLKEPRVPILFSRTVIECDLHLDPSGPTLPGKSSSPQELGTRSFAVRGEGTPLLRRERRGHAVHAPPGEHIRDSQCWR